jgi:hypothetical protein
MGDCSQFVSAQPPASPARTRPSPDPDERASTGDGNALGGTPPLELSSRRDIRGSGAIAFRALVTSRLVVLFAGVLAVLEIGQAPGTTGFYGEPLTSPFGYFGNLLAAPFARWDSGWYLSIAQGGYDHQLARTAFFPLYPVLMRGLGLAVGSDLIAGVVISLAAFWVALALLHRLASLELGGQAAELTVLLVAFCPVAYFFSAIYTESLYLALSLACLLCARSGRWALAGLLGGLAALSRNSGAVLIVPVVLMFLYGPRTDAAPAPVRAGWARLLPRYRLTPAILWSALIPLGLLVYLGYLGLTMHDALAPFHAQALWYRHFGVFAGVWKGAVAAWDGLRQLVHGPPPPIYFKLAGGDPLQVAGENLLLFASLILGLIALVGVFRTLPFAYFAYAVCSLVLPLSEPVIPQPLASLPRYEVVVFPLFMWLAALLLRHRLAAAGLATCGVLLGLFTAEFATWRFVA